MKLKVIDISPELAQSWLSKSGKNRKKNTGHIKRLAEKMAEGRWIVNGQTISFDSEGNLIDGQHRLEAIVMAGVTIKHAVAFDVEDPRAFKSYDAESLKRGAHHISEMMGVKNATNVTSSARFILTYENAKDMEDFSYLLGSKRYLPPEQLADESCRLEEEISEAAQMIGSRFAKNAGSPSSIVGLIVIFNRIDPIATAGFCRKLKTGVFDNPNDPCLLLRDMLLTDKTRRRGIKHLRTVVAITIKAFNLYRAGKEISILRWRIEGDKPERFPVIIGGDKK